MRQHKLYWTILLALFAVTSTSTSAQPLTGSGANLPIPTPNPGAPANQARSITTGGSGFTGTWTAPALTPWVGSFSAVGPVPSGISNPTGITVYDFTSMPTGVLPVGTYFRFGDVDQGSTTTETFILQAFDSSGMVTSPWLDAPIGVTGTGIGTTTMPGWSFNTTTGAYTIDGSTVIGNPNVALYLPNNTALTMLEIQRTSGFANFSLHAPIPTPGSLGLLAAGGWCLARRRR
ncbi:MAG: hypothetical protein ACF8GE_07565 [Phycisphaerales bacterium JB043]